VFGTPEGLTTRAKIVELAQGIFDKSPTKRSVKAREFAMEDNPDVVVATEVDIRWDGERLRIAATEASARPPFEWLMEITSNVGEADYFKHYLVREEDVVLAQRKVLTPIDAVEANIIIHDLQVAASHV
jgi:hypothetical protein